MTQGVERGELGSIYCCASLPSGPEKLASANNATKEETESGGRELD